MLVINVLPAVGQALVTFCEELLSPQPPNCYCHPNAFRVGLYPIVRLSRFVYKRFFGIQEGVQAIMKRWQKIAISMTIGATLALRATFFAISVTHLQPSSDESIVMLQARDITQGKHPILFMSQPYLFPMESYLTAPFSGFLPSSAFGARVLPALIGLLALGVAVLVMKHVSPAGITWVNLLLILFPSSYFLMLQVAYALPGYVTAQITGGLSVLAALWQRREKRHPILLALATGFITGLSFCGHPLLLPFVLVISLYVCLDTNLRTSLKKSAAFIPGLLLGLTPYILAKAYFPDSCSIGFSSFGIKETIQRLWTPTLTQTLSTALGIRTCLFPDNQAVSLFDIPLPLFALIWSCFLLGILAWRTRMFFRRLIRQKWIFLEEQDLFIWIALLTLANFALNKRADSQSFRYLLPFLWCFPFMMDSLYARASGWIRHVLLAVIILLTVWNIGTSVFLMQHWRADDFPTKEASIADLRPALVWLKEHNIQHCVASHGAAYRINFQSGYNILCAQPQNERFPRWPLPYKEQVDSATDVAYVLTDSIRFLKPEIFERHMRHMNVECRKTKVGDFFIYNDFKGTSILNVIPRQKLAFTASHSSENADRMNDDVMNQPWSSCAFQKSGMWIEITSKVPITVSGLRLFYAQWSGDRPGKMDVLTRVDGEWKTLASVDESLEKFWFHNNHPIYDTSPKTVTWPAITVNTIRIVITAPRSESHWIIGELQMFRPPSDNDSH